MAPFGSETTCNWMTERRQHAQLPAALSIAPLCSRIQFSHDTINIYPGAVEWNGSGGAPSLVLAIVTDSLAAACSRAVDCGIACGLTAMGAGRLHHPLG